MLELFDYGFVAVLLLAAGQDLRKLKISNVFPVALVALYLARALIVGLEADMWENLVVFGLSLGAGLFMFAMRWLGGGDVKLFAAAALWFDLTVFPHLILAISIGGAMLALAFIAIRRMLPSSLEERTGWTSLKQKGPIPYGLAIAGGAILCSSTYPFNPAPPANVPIQGLLMSASASLF